MLAHWCVCVFYLFLELRLQFFDHVIDLLQVELHVDLVVEQEVFFFFHQLLDAHQVLAVIVVEQLHDIVGVRLDGLDLG